MKFYTKALLAGMLVLVAACANLATVPKPATLTVHQRYESACVGAGVAYGIITQVNNVHTLTAAQQGQARAAKAKIDKRCKLAPGEDYPYSASDAVMSELEDAAGTLQKIKGEVQ